MFRLDENEKLFEILAYLGNNRAFYGPELNLENRVLVTLTGGTDF